MTDKGDVIREDMSEGSSYTDVALHFLTGGGRTGSGVTATSLPPDLARAFAVARAEVRTLGRVFGGLQVPKTVAEWKGLPTTGPQEYEEARGATGSVRNLDGLFAPSAPFDLLSPSFPSSVLHSYADKLALDERLSVVLDALGCVGSQDFVFVSGRRQRYFASDLAELLIALGHGCVFMLLDRPSAADFARLRALDGAYVFWHHAEVVSQDLLPETVRGVVTFNRHPRLSGVTHVDVLQIDAVPLLGFGGSGGRYSFLSSHFHLEYSNGELLVTTLRQDMLPLIRYRTGLFVEPDGFQDGFLTLEDR